MKKISVFLSFLILFSFQMKADEGMWLLPLLEKMNIKTMQDMGCKLSAEDIYSINHSSIKDAIVHFGGGCTAEIISNEGLVITNHHCGYSSIQKLSSVEHDYLTDGYWAMNRSQELRAPGLSVVFLQSMTDITAQVEKIMKKSEEKQEKALQEIVDMAGEDACTICFPDAPVNQQSRLPFRVEEREAADKARAEREAKKAKAAADLIPYGTRPSQSFKTLRSAENEVGRFVSNALSSRYMAAQSDSHRVHLDNLAEEYAAEARAIVAAIEAARPGYDGAALVAKKVAKEAKELRKYSHYTVPAEPTL